ncbi:MAG: hypothetical protein M5U28_23320 [Sandaracinaceae bacterium]|nr:hypothetical protein [Sandaracinaceae bacterium]
MATMARSPMAPRSVARTVPRKRVLIGAKWGAPLVCDDGMTNHRR